MSYDIRNVFITGLCNAHALESQALTIMKAQVSRLDQYQVRDKISSHIAETERQRLRLENIFADLQG